MGYRDAGINTEAGVQRLNQYSESSQFFKKSVPRKAIKGWLRGRGRGENTNSARLGRAGLQITIEKQKVRCQQKDPDEHWKAGGGSLMSAVNRTLKTALQHTH